MTVVASRLPVLRVACVPQSNQYADGRTKILTAWQLLQRKHIGQILYLDTEVSFQKRSWRRLSDEAREYPHELRVPARSFGFGLLSAAGDPQHRGFPTAASDHMDYFDIRKKTHTQREADIAVPGVLVHFSTPTLSEAHVPDKALTSVVSRNSAFSRPLRSSRFVIDIDNAATPSSTPMTACELPSKC